MQRRDFIRVLGIGAPVFVAGCGGGQGGSVTVVVPPGSSTSTGGTGGGSGSGGTGTVARNADVVLTDDTAQTAMLLRDGALANRIATVMSTPEQFSQKPSNVLRVGIGADAVDFWADDISFLENTPQYRRVVAQRQSDGDIVEFHLETDGLSPKLVLRRRSNGQRVATVGFNDVTRRSRLAESHAQLTATDLLSIGTQVFAVALAIWLGASISRAVIGAIAFIAFNAMVIGIVLAAIGLLTPIVRALLDFVGISTFGDATAFFRRVVDELRLLFDQVVSFLRSFLPELTLRSAQAI